MRQLLILSAGKYFRMSSDKLAVFETGKYLNLETYRSNGQAVKTPVWFVVDDGIIFVVTPSVTGKIKRLHQNTNVRIVPSNMKGIPKGDWIDGTAYFANESESIRATKLRRKKYGLMAMLVDLFVYKKNAHTVIGIKV